MEYYIKKNDVVSLLMNEAKSHKLSFSAEAYERAANIVACMPNEDVQPVNQWISVKDRLPEAVEKDVNGKIAFSDFVLVYLVYDNGFTYMTVDKCRVDDKSWLHEIPGEGCKVTHWMPLPEPPKDGDTE